MREWLLALAPCALVICFAAYPDQLALLFFRGKSTVAIRMFTFSGLAMSGPSPSATIQGTGKNCSDVPKH